MESRRNSLLNTNQILELFLAKNSELSYLDFETSSEVSQSKSIRNREIATVESFKASSLDKTAELEGSASYATIHSLVQTIMQSRLLPEIEGILVELGSGIGLLGIAFIAEDLENDIAGVLAVEAGLPFVETGIRMAADQLLAQNSRKVIPCYGTFDSIKLEDRTVDAIIQIEALHHSNDLQSALDESFRILKSGGYVISIDRSWPDSTTRNVLEDLLNHEYPKDWLEFKGFPSHEPFTRRDNGEHEYLDKDWKAAFSKAGFSLLSFNTLHPKIKLWHILKRAIRLMKVEKIMGIKISSRKGIFRGLLFGFSPFLASKLGGVIVTDHPRSLTLQIYRKS